jgi:calpain-15
MIQKKLSFGSSSSLKSNVEPFTDHEFPPSPESIDGRQIKSTTILSENNQIHCYCNIEAKIKQIYKEGPNQGRYYLSCGSNKQYGSINSNTERLVCNFFSFADNYSHDKKVLELKWIRFNKENGWKFIPSSGFSINHINQGGIGDCWFLSAIAVICERRLDLIGKIVLGNNLSDETPINFCLYLDGNWQNISIDNYLPCSKNKNDSEFVLKYCRPRGKIMWVPFLEKAFAKFHGSFQAISGGTISEVKIL